jgi:dihydrofolate synthase/folylpolyglutamate synthase
MNYEEAIAYLYSFSDFERGGPFTRNREENLAREEYLLKQLGNPQEDYTSTLIAGTKGKGSTASFIERVLRETGLRTGLYTQPDLHTFRERIRINGELISKEDTATLLTEMRPIVDSVQAEQRFAAYNTYQVGTALAFLAFSRLHVQHAVLEVGLGGRLDATNVTHPLVSVIASISYDHMQVLGNTLTQIATEKAGIIKPNGVIVTSAQSPEALLAIASVSQRQIAHLIRVGSFDVDPARQDVEHGLLPPITYGYRLEDRNEARQRFTVQAPDHSYEHLEIPLAGQHQLENATLALAVLEQLRNHGVVWDEQALRAGFNAVNWPARLEVIGHHPTMIVDGAHNADSMQKLVLALNSTYHWERLIIVLGIARDKDLSGIVQALANSDTVILTHAANPRAATIVNLQTVFAEYAPKVQVLTAGNSGEAMDLAAKLAGENDLICATGSLYLAGEVLRWSAAHGNEQVASMIGGVDQDH